MGIFRYGLALILVLLSSVAQSNYEEYALTHDAKHLAEWVTESGDNQGLPFIIIDKKQAQVFLFHTDGKLNSSAPALLGIKIGDDITPGTGNKTLTDITLEEKTTPAGRFEANLGFSPSKSEMLWIDYESGFSMHSVVTSNPSERRLQRLASSKISERRITYGCVNVASLFYQGQIHEAFKNSNGIVYVLPEIHSIQKIFGSEAARFNQCE